MVIKKYIPPPPSPLNIGVKVPDIEWQTTGRISSGLWPQTKTLGISGHLFVGGWGGKNDRGAVAQFCDQSLSLKKKAEESYYSLYCQTSLHEHPLNTDTSLLLTDSLFSPWGKKALPFSLKSTRLIHRHPVNMDTFYAPLSNRIDGV